MKDITENNRLIAEFMEMEYGEKLDFVNGKWIHSIRSLDKFRNSWDWLMPVVDKINNIGIVHGDEGFYLIEIIKDALTDVSINGVYDSIIDFIKWYNENK